MPANGLVATAARQRAPASSLDGAADRAFFGVASAKVVNNLDLKGLGRVQVRIPGLREFEPWARVAVLMAGMSRGTYFIPQIGEEVLVAFNGGDVRDPVVIGGLWNAQDPPPRRGLTDSVTKRVLKTPLGHEIEFDDLAQSITIKSTTNQKVTIDPAKVEVTTTGGTAKMTLTTLGTISVEAKIAIQMKAPLIGLEAKVLRIKTDVITNIMAGAIALIKAKLIKLG